jgi:hypothetical protein
MVNLFCQKRLQASIADLLVVGVGDVQEGKLTDLLPGITSISNSARFKWTILPSYQEYLFHSHIFKNASVAFFAVPTACSARFCSVTSINTACDRTMAPVVRSAVAVSNMSITSPSFSRIEGVRLLKFRFQGYRYFESITRDSGVWNSAGLRLTRFVHIL